MALGVGQIAVRSALNESLVAEIPLTATAEELDSLDVTLAPVAAYQQVGVTRLPELDSIQFTIEREPSPRIRIVSEQAMREPLVTLLLELDWTGGRLVREFGLLLDPSEGVLTQSGAQAVAAAPTRQSAPAPASAAPRRTVPAAVQTPAPPRIAVDVVPGVSHGPVQPGETLWAIAESYRPANVTVNQFMDAMVAANPAAFIGGSADQLRAGAVLRIPAMAGVRLDGASPAPVAATSTTTDDPAQPRVRLLPADTEAAPEAVEQVAGGTRINPPTASLQLDSAFKIKFSQGQPVLRVATLEDLRSRINSLVGVDDAALVAVTSSSPAATSPSAQPAPTPSPAPSPATGAGTSAQPFQETGTGQVTETPAPAPAPAPVVAPPAPPPVVAAPAPAPAPVVAPPPPPAVTAPPAPRPSAATPPPPPPSDSLIDRLLGDPIMLGGIGAVILLAIGGAVVLMRRRRQDAALEDDESGELGFETIDHPLSDDTSSSMGRDVPGLAAAAAEWADTDLEATASDAAPKVRPVTSNAMERVDLLLAVGNYREAENVARAALEEDATNADLGMKLLEVYFATGNETAFVEQAELLSERLLSTDSAQWGKVVDMGRQLCPEHPLFGGDAPPAASGAVSGSAGQGDEFDFDLGGLDDEPAPVAPRAAAPAAAGADDLDFDLMDFGDQSPAAAPPVVRDTPKAAPAPAAAADDLDFDFDSSFDFDAGERLDTPVAKREQEIETQSAEDVLDNTFTVEESAPTVSGDDDLGMELQDLDFDLGGEPAPSPATRTTAELPAADDGLDDLQFSTGADEAPAAKTDDDAAVLDELSFDFDSSSSTAAMSDDLDNEPRNLASDDTEDTLVFDTASTGSDTSDDVFGFGDVAASGDDFDLDADGFGGEDHVETKLALAEAYIDMEDKDGARSLLEEVLTEGSDVQRRRAEEMMGKVA